MGITILVSICWEFHLTIHSRPTFAIQIPCQYMFFDAPNSVNKIGPPRMCRFLLILSHLLFVLQIETHKLLMALVVFFC